MAMSKVVDNPALEPDRFIVQVVFREKEDGKVIAERFTEPLVFYSRDQLAEWTDGFDALPIEVK